MSADAATLKLMAKRLDERADDLIYVGRKLSSNAEGAAWTCAKADRYRAAMRSREQEFRKVAAQIHELALHLQRLAARTEAGPATGT